MPLAALCGPLPGAALLFAPLKRCAWSPVVRPCLPPVRRAQHHSLVCCGYSCSAHRLLSWGRSSHAPRFRPFVVNRNVSFGVSRPLRYSGHWSERSFTEERGEEVGMSRNVIVVAIVVIVIVVFLYLILRLF
jgi:hypothetical protein